MGHVRFRKQWLKIFIPFINSVENLYPHKYVESVSSACLLYQALKMVVYCAYVAHRMGKRLQVK